MAQLLPLFLSTAEVADLCAQAAAAAETSWAPGRQHTGYDILPLRPAQGLTSPLIARAIAQLGAPFGDHWDAYFLRYLDGAHIPPHTDPAQHGRRHRRLNAVLAQATRGGELTISGVHVPLAVGDAIVFDPDRDVHEVSAVVGTRLLFSVGALI